MWIPIITDLKPMIAEISNTEVHERTEIRMNDTYSSLLGNNDDDDNNNGRNQFAFEYVLFAMGLINAILNSFTSLEDRVAYRKDLEQLGFDKIVSYLSDLIISMEEALMDQYDEDEDDDDIIDDPWIDKMDEHLEMYQAVKLKDMRDSSLDGIDVSNPADLFEFLDQHCVEDGFLNEFTHILQCLTTIPRNAPYLWSTIEKIVSYSTAPIRKTQLNDMMRSGDDNNIDDETKERLQDDLITLEQEPEDAFPSFDQLKVMLSRYDQDLAYMESESTHYQEQIGLLQEQILNLKYQLSQHQSAIHAFAKENKKLKTKAMTGDIITVERKDLDNVLNNKNNKRSKHKRKSSLLDKIGITGIFKSQISGGNNQYGNNALYDDDEDQLIDVSNAWQGMNNAGMKSPVSLITSTTEGTPPPIHAHTLSASSTNNKPRGYATRQDMTTPTNTMTTASFSIIDDVKNGEDAELGSNGVAVVTAGGGLGGGLPPPPLSPDGLSTKGISATPSILSPTTNTTTSEVAPGAILDAPGSTAGAINDVAPPSVSVVGPPTELKPYLKMLRMRLPQVAVEHKMRKDGLDPELLIEYLENGGSIEEPKAAETSTTPQTSNTTTTNNKTTEKKEDKSGADKKEDNAAKKGANKEPPEKLKKYLKMMKLKIPLNVVKNKMKQNGDNPQDLEDWLNPPQNAEEDDKPREPPKELERYLKMLKMKIPLNVIKNKMKQNGDDPQKLEDWLNPPQKNNKPKEPPKELERYLKMLKMKIPLNVVKNKMKQNGDNPQKLEDWLNGGSDDKPKEPPEKLKKYLKMQKMKIPLRVILNKMKQNGDNPQDLENWLNGSSSSSSSSKSKSKKKKKPDPNELPPGMKAKPKIKPNKKMRALHWTTVRPKEIKNTIWDGLDETKIKIDVGGFEQMFQQKVTAPKGGKGGDKKSKKKMQDEKKNEEIHLVDGKRSYNVDIGLNRFKLSHQQIKDAILLMDEITLNLDKVTKLRNYIPDTSEQEILRNFDGDVTLLAHTERFFLALCNIPDLSGRMELWQFKLQFSELLEIQMDRIEILRQSHDNVKNSASFKIVLKYILAYGNYMNGGTKKGQAHGFKLNSLRQIASAKSVDNKSTLMYYLYMQIEKENGSALQFINDFEILAEGSRLDTSQLTAEVSKIGGSLRKIEKKLKSDTKVKTPRSQHDLFAKKMVAFLDDSQPKYDRLKKEHDKAKADCVKLAEYFNCKNDIKFEFFKDLYEFSQLFKQTGVKIKKEREKAAKELKNAQIKAARQKQKEERMKKKRLSNSTMGNGNNKKSKTNGKQHRRTSSNRANQLYSKNGLSKKRGSIKKGGGGGGATMDPQLQRMLQKQRGKSPSSPKTNMHQTYAQRRQSRNNSRSVKRQKSNQQSPLKPPPVPTNIFNQINTNLDDDEKLNEQSTPNTNSNNTMVTYDTNSNNGYDNNDGPTSPIQPTTPMLQQEQQEGVSGGLSGLPPPPEVEDSFDENHNINGIHSPITENVVNDIKLSEVQNRRKASSQVSRSKSRTKSKEQTRHKVAQYPTYATSPKNKKKKKKKWFGF